MITVHALVTKSVDDLLHMVWLYTFVPLSVRYR